MDWKAAIASSWNAFYRNSAAGQVIVEADFHHAALTVAMLTWDECSLLRDRLTAEERNFVYLVSHRPGSKLNGGEAVSSSDLRYPLWTVPERLGFIECVGSYKWKPGPNYAQFSSSTS